MEEGMTVEDRVRNSPDVPHEQFVGGILPDGLVLEFGVASGSTLRVWSNALTPREVWGFDTFTGLPMDWGTAHKKGDFGNRGLVPDGLPPGCACVVGLFEETLQPFLEVHWQHAAFVHFDCDLYESADFVLRALEKRFVPGTVLAFDEFIDYRDSHDLSDASHWRNGEYKAFCEYLGRNPEVEWEALGKNSGSRALIRITKC